MVLAVHGQDETTYNFSRESVLPATAHLHLAALPVETRSSMDADFALSLENTSEPPTPRRARTVMVRKALRGDSQRLELESSETSRGRAVMLAHRMHPGQTTKLVSRQGVRGTLNDEEFTRSQPESVALTRADQRQPRFSSDGHVVPHSVIGDPAEYETLRQEHTKRALAELEMIPRPPNEQRTSAPPAGRPPPKTRSIWPGTGGGGPSSKPSSRTGRRLSISEKLMESQAANQEKNWQRWDQRWDTQQNDLAEQFGKPIDQLVLNSNEEYNNKVRFLDLLEKSNPPALDENKRFMVAVRDANIYYAPIGVRHKIVMSSVLYCGVKV